MAEKATETKKFQTRAGISRKSKEEREAYAREEAARQQSRIAESAQTLTGSVPEKGRASARGRSNVLPNSTNRLRSENIGGVFGAAGPSLPRPRGTRNTQAILAASEEIAQSSQPGPLGKSSAAGALGQIKVSDAGDSFVVKSGSKTTARTKATALIKDDPDYLSSEDDADEAARRDIEHIWISSDEEAVSSRLVGKQKNRSSARHGTALRPLRAPRDSRVEGEALSARNRIISSLAGNEASLIGEDATRGRLVKDDGTMDTNDKIPPLLSPDIDRKISKRKGARLKDAIGATETAEEHAERLRYNEEVRKLVGELDQHISTTDAEALQPHKSAEFHDRRLYLFQFPPLTPVLADPAEEIEVKQESGGEAQPVPLDSDKTPGVAVKKEEGAEETKKKKSDVLTADNMELPSGLAGTLRVHKSGKVTLDWGGTDLEVRYGTEVDFLQDVVMTDEAERVAWALGQVEKKMVCIPNWQKLYE